jgi:hypothetical protein
VEGAELTPNPEEVSVLDYHGRVWTSCGTSIHFQVNSMIRGKMLKMSITN